MTDNRLASLQRMAEQCVELSDRIKSLEELSYQLKGELLGLLTRTIPDTMAELGLKSLETSSGRKLALRFKVDGCLPSDPAAREQALKWLADNDGEDIIKTQLELSFGKSQHNEAVNVEHMLQENGQMYAKREGVHAKTLQAFVKSKVLAGEEVPFELLGVYARNVAEIKEGKDD